MTTHLRGGRASLRIPTPLIDPNTVPKKPVGSAEAKQTIKIYLRNAGRYATLYRADYQRVIAEVGGNVWFVGYNSERAVAYVRTWSDAEPRKMAMIARIVANAPARTAVRYLDGDPLNLRFDNLYVDMTGGSGGCKKRPKGSVNVMENREKTKAAFAAQAPLRKEQRRGV